MEEGVDDVIYGLHVTFLLPMLSRKFPLPTNCSGFLQSPTTLTHGTDVVCVVVQFFPWFKFYSPLF